MAAGGLARRKLQQARFFTLQAEQAGLHRRENFVNFLEAAIVFGRSVTFHLQKEYTGRPSFGEWYAAQQQAMQQDPLLQFFKETRNFVLKAGALGVQKRVSLIIEDHLTLSESLDIRVIRGQPWYQRTLRVLWQDFRRQAVELVGRTRKRFEGWLQRRRPPKKTAIQVAEELFFDDARWQDRPAVSLLQEYMGGLEQVVAEAERRFAHGGT